MKKLLVILFFILFTFSLTMAETKIFFRDIEINKKLEDYFSKADIKKYTLDLSGMGPEVDMWNNNEIYSKLFFASLNPVSEKFNTVIVQNSLGHPIEVFNIISIAYNNNNWKIEHTDAHAQDLKNCKKFRDDQLSIYNNRFKNYKKNNIISETNDGIEFRHDNLVARLFCFTYPKESFYAGQVDFIFKFSTLDYDKWWRKKEKIYNDLVESLKKEDELKNSD